MQEINCPLWIVFTCMFYTFVVVNFLKGGYTKGGSFYSMYKKGTMTEGLNGVMVNILAL